MYCKGEKIGDCTTRFGLYVGEKAVGANCASTRPNNIDNRYGLDRLGPLLGIIGSPAL